MQVLFLFVSLKQQWLYYLQYLFVNYIFVCLSRRKDRTMNNEDTVTRCA